MRKIILIGLLAVLLVGLGIWRGRVTAERNRAVGGDEKFPATVARVRPLAPQKAGAPSSEPPRTDASPARTAAEEKAARIEKIKRDYEELAAKIGADFNAAGANYPGGLNGYLRQLALLEQEKWKDFAGFLSPDELTELGLRETRAGREVQRWLGDAAGVTDEQRRTVFRLQRDFDEAYALVFDLKPSALLQRETERQAMQEKILSVLGPEGFAAWARTEGANFGAFTRFVAQQGLPTETAVELWRVKNAFTRQHLTNEAQDGVGEEERARLRGELIAKTRERIVALVSRAAFEAADPAVFAWFERRK